MAGDAYTFTGLVTTGFYSYRDLGTGKMLTAEPGQSYRIGAVGEGPPDEDGNPTALPVPPDPSLWELTPPEVPAAKAAKTASNGTKDGE